MIGSRAKFLIRGFGLFFFLFSPHFSHATRNLVVLVGGFGSCAWMGSPSEMGMWPALKASLEDAALEHAYEDSASDFVVRVCFAIGKEPLYFDLIEHQKQILAFHAINSVYVKRGSYSGGRGDLSRILKTLQSKLYQEQLAAQEQLNFVLIGQSHGGDFAMDLTLELKVSTEMQELLAASNSRVTLLTIDPISREFCGPEAFVGGFFKKVAGCQGFPQKSVEALQGVRDFVHNWMHFYQEEFHYLHSGPQPLANLSTKLDFSTKDGGGPFGAHGLTEVDDRIWSNLTASF